MHRGVYLGLCQFALSAHLAAANYVQGECGGGQRGSFRRVLIPLIANMSERKHQMKVVIVSDCSWQVSYRNQPKPKRKINVILFFIIHSTHLENYSKVLVVEIITNIYNDSGWYLLKFGSILFFTALIIKHKVSS